MKTVLLLVVASAGYLACASPIHKDGEEDQQRFLEFAGSNGEIHRIDLEETPDLDLITRIQRNEEGNQYFLYTRKNPTVSQSLFINDRASIWSSNFNPNVPTVVLVHGWLVIDESSFNHVVKEAYLSKSDVNVIVMEWRHLALANYVTSVLGVPTVGQQLGQFLSFLRDTTGASFDSIHLVGFSLGAHVVGNAGRSLGGKLARITGLDPAGSLWTYNTNKISKNDAVYVEAIHTNGELLGYGIGTAVADADFFPNGGTGQPGCLTYKCSHNRSWELFAASVTYNHLIARKCRNNLQLTWNTCHGDTLPMGNDDLNKSGSGIYRVKTDSTYPF